jgi:hypothetical protein
MKMCRRDVQLKDKDVGKHLIVTQLLTLFRLQLASKQCA